METKVVLALIFATVACVQAIGTQSQYGYQIIGPYGAAQVHAAADEHAYGYQVNNQHKTGVSYIKQSGPNYHGIGYGLGGYGLGYGLGLGGVGLYGGGIY